MLNSATTPPRLITLILLSGLSVVTLNMFVASLANIAAEFQADYALVNLSIAGYAGMTAVLQLIMGPVSDRFGRRPVILAGLVIFILASLGCMLASDIWTFLFFRLLQGAIVSGWVISNAVVRDMVPAQDAASLLGYLAMAWSVAPMLGPMFGGILDDLFGWRASFVAFAGVGAAIFCLCWIDLGETNKTPSATFAEQFRSYPELVQSRRFWGYALCMAFSVGAFYVFMSGVPLVATTMFGLSSATLGFYMGTITAGFFLGSFLSGRYSRRYPLTTMIIAGRIVACTGLVVGLVLFLSGVVHVLTLFGACMCVGIGNGLTMPSSNSGVMSLRPRLAGSAAGLSGALTVGGGAVMSSMTGALMSEEYGVYPLLSMMLFSSLMGFAAALYVRRVDRIEASKP
jgi:Bcr/CflA subfamily drug resistance transporter